MDVTELERAVRETEVKGHIPLAVVGTAGTTVMGAFDPLNRIADICAQHSMWLHVDVSMCVCVVMTCEGLPVHCPVLQASYGGSVLMSAKHRHLCQGIDRWV